jgi:hypothetical protein
MQQLRVNVPILPKVQLQPGELVNLSVIFA